MTPKIANRFGKVRAQKKCRVVGTGRPRGEKLNQRPDKERDVFAKSSIIAIAAVGAAMLAGATVAQADGVPGLRGHDHTGITVPDIKQATDFFVNVLGCKEAMSFGPFADEKGNFMTSIRAR